MTSDQDIVRQIQRRVRNWKPEEECTERLHHRGQKCCDYDRQGRLINLHLCGLNLTQIPLEVWHCSSLRGLYLTNNQLRTLPAEVGQLSSLQVLDLKINQLRTLPVEVSQLSSLRALYLSHNQLGTLPVEVGQLSSLEWLDLDRNQLRTLPVEVSQLSSLRILALSHNQLRTLPVEVGQLSSLEWLDLGNNQFRTLPAEMSQLTALRWLELYNNPLQPPPPSIYEVGISGFLAYVRTLQSVKIFYCYAHEDKNLRDRIDSHLGVLKRLGQVVGWYDREIQAGTEWEREIETHLSTARIILLLVSADFVNSDYCYGVEMQRALEMHEKGKACVLPILLRPVDWQGAPFAKLQMLPTGAKPITTWLNQDEALEDVAKQIRAVVTTLRIHQS